MFSVWCNICGQTIMLCVCSCEVDIAVNGVYPMEERPSTAQKHFDARSSPVKYVRIGKDDDEQDSDDDYDYYDDYKGDDDDGSLAPHRNTLMLGPPSQIFQDW